MNALFRLPRICAGRVAGIFYILLFSSFVTSFASELQTFSNCRLIESPANDGDSFKVAGEVINLTLRLYFIDCPETEVDMTADARRVQEQTRYFGLKEPERTLHFGRQAREFTRQALQHPFTVHTAKASAMGRSTEGRVYGFVTTADGKDLGMQLVENGLARVHGIGRETPTGISRKEMIARLQDMETAAMLKHVGIWAESDPARIVELRADQRREDQPLKEMQTRLSRQEPAHGSISLNKATATQLQQIRGIGPVLAERIIAGRPYPEIDELLRVHGIGPKNLEKMRPYLTLDDNNAFEE